MRSFLTPSVSPPFSKSENGGEESSPILKKRKWGRGFSLSYTFYKFLLNHACDPHPNPLPRGEGVAIPSPLRGEGEGEGSDLAILKSVR